MPVSTERLAELIHDYQIRASKMEKSAALNMPKQQRNGVMAEVKRFRDTADALKELATIRKALA